MRFIIHANEATGTVEYDETHTTTTNSVGLVNLFIGTGTPAATTFDAIDWSNTTKYLEVQLDLGAGYTSLGTQQMMSVPFALYACSGVGEQGPQGVQGEPGTSVEAVVLENNHVIATLTDGTVIDAGAIAIMAGCTDNTACNYDPNANFYNGLCSYVGGACNDSDENTINDYYTADCVCEGTPTTTGCTNPAACNYDASAFIDNGSCLYVGGTCDDNNPETLVDFIDSDCACTGNISSGSGNGSELLPGLITCSDENISVSSCGGLTSLDYNGHSYDLVEIGGQCWFAENLVTTQFNDGTEIPLLANTELWSSTDSSAYCYWLNNQAYAEISGAIYNGHAAAFDNVCPVGWHVPTDCEWMYLEASIGMPLTQLEYLAWRGTIEGGKLKSTVGWAAPNVGATNSTGFNAIPAGNGRSANNIYTTFGSEDYYYDAGFWSKSATDSETAIARSLRFDGSAIYRFISDKNAGLSIRCLKD
jgi:uncharacterized protein (TIGR02145 family)